MSIFSDILDRLGLGNKPKPAASSTPKPPKPAEPAAPSAPAATHPTHKPAIATPSSAEPTHKPVGSAPAPSAPRPMVSHKPAEPTHKPSVTLPTAQMPEATASTPEPEVEPMSKVDVMAKLEGMAAKLGTPSNWKTSIADLLFLLGMDHSYAARKELAVELGCPPEYLDDSVKMNTWLHKTVLAKIAENGGNIPAELLD
jgi:Domain of unknown function (DUF3597)